MNGQSIPADQFVEDKVVQGAIPADQFVEDPPTPDLPNNSAMKEYLDKNFHAYFEDFKKRSAQVPKTLPEADANVPSFLGIEHKESDGKVKKAGGIVDALEAGLQTSIGGLAVRGEGPNVVLPEHAPMYMSIAYQLGQTLPDLPVYGVGAAAGAELGPIGAGAGAFALPTALRKIMMDHYEKGDIKTFEDFWTRLSSTTIDSMKSAVIGGATAGIGGKVAQAIGATAAHALVKTAAQTGSEIATMTTVGKALEGQMPNLQDFTEAAILVGGLHATGVLSSKLKDVYAKTGIHPSDVALQSENSPTIQQDLLSINKEIPDAYKNAQDPSTIPKSVEFPLDAQGDLFNNEFSKDTLTIEEPEKTTQQETPKTEPTDIDKALAPIKEMIGKKDEPTLIGKLSDAIADERKNFYLNRIDKFTSIEDINKNAYELARLTAGSVGKAEGFLLHNTRDIKGNVTGEGLAQAVESVPLEQKDNFSAFLLAAKTKELKDLNPKFKTNISKEQADTAVEAAKGQFGEAQKKFTAYNNRLLDLIEGAELIPKGTAKDLADKYAAYVPFKYLEEGVISNGPTRRSLIKGLKGTEENSRVFLDPVEAAKDNTILFTKAAEVNKVKLELLKEVLKDKDQTLFKVVEDEHVPVKIRIPKDVASEFPSLFGEGEKGAEKPKEILGFMQKYKELETNQFDFFKNGKRVVIETTPEIAASIKALDGDQIATSAVMKLLQIPATSLRTALSITPAFQIKNKLRDEVTKSVFTSYGSGVSDTLWAIKELLGKKNSEVYKEFLASGGYTRIANEINRDYIEKDIFKLSKETGMMDRAWNVISSPAHMLEVAKDIPRSFLQAIKTVGDVAELAPRLAEFRAGTKGVYNEQTRQAAAMSAREVTVDFQRIGLKQSALNSLIAFHNAQIQGVDRAYRALRDNPGKTIRLGTSLITLPSVLLWMINKDDPRYQDLPSWQKNLFWIYISDAWQKSGAGESSLNLPDYLKRTNKAGEVEINRGTIFRFPKPQEIGMLFGSLPERILDAAFTNNPVSGKDFMSDLYELLKPSLIPNAAIPVVETYSNKSLFTGNAIIPSYAEKLAPELRYTDYTSETAKAFSGLIAKIPGTHDITPAPATVDNWIQAWAGDAGKSALWALDKAGTKAGLFDNNKQAPGLADDPIIKSFVVRHPSAGTEPIRKVFDEAKLLEEDLASAKFMAQNEKPIEAQKYMDKLGDMQHAQAMIGTAKVIGEMFGAIHKIRQSKQYTDVEKTQQIESIYYQANEMSKKAISTKGETK